MTADILSHPAPEPDELLTWGPLPDQVADLFLGSTDKPVLIALHGGFWRPAYDRTHLRHLGRAFSDLGYSVVLPEYRRALGDPDVTTDDVRVGLHVLPTAVHGYFDGRVVLLGHSAGGHLALWASAACPPSGLIGTLALAPIADLQQADVAGLGRGAVRDFLGGPASSRVDLDPTLLGAPATRTIVIMGGQDDVVPTPTSDGYLRAHPDVTVDVLETADHYDLIDPRSPIWPSITATLDDVCRVSS